MVNPMVETPVTVVPTARVAAVATVVKTLPTHTADKAKAKAVTAEAKIATEAILADEEVVVTTKALEVEVDLMEVVNRAVTTSTLAREAAEAAITVLLEETTNTPAKEVQAAAMGLIRELTSTQAKEVQATTTVQVEETTNTRAAEVNKAVTKDTPPEVKTTSTHRSKAVVAKETTRPAVVTTITIQVVVVDRVDSNKASTNLWARKPLAWRRKRSAATEVFA